MLSLGQELGLNPSLKSTAALCGFRVLSRLQWRLVILSPLLLVAA